jgi:hypothetical protein
MVYMYTLYNVSSWVHGIAAAVQSFQPNCRALVPAMRPRLSHMFLDDAKSAVAGAPRGVASRVVVALIVSVVPELLDGLHRVVVILRKRVLGAACVRPRHGQWLHPSSKPQHGNKQQNTLQAGQCTVSRSPSPHSTTHGPPARTCREHRLQT